MLDAQGLRVVDGLVEMRNRAAEGQINRPSCQLVPSDDPEQKQVEVRQTEHGIWQHVYGPDDLARLDRKAEYLLQQMHRDPSAKDEASQSARGEINSRSEASLSSYRWLTGATMSLLLAACGIS